MGPSIRIVGLRNGNLSQTNLVYHIFFRLTRGNPNKIMSFLFILKIFFARLTEENTCVIVLVH